MIKKLICWLWGHKFTVKAYTGETYQTTNYIGSLSTVSLYKLAAQKYCLRCGVKNPNEVD